MIKRQKITLGSIFELHIENEYYVYGQILTAGNAFFDFKSEKKVEDFSVLNNVPLLFIVSVYSYTITKGIWLKVGKLEIRENLKYLPLEFIQDSINREYFSLYDPNTGEITSATKEQCLGLECAAVWASNHVEDRIRDHYLGVPNIWLEQTKIK
jgi:hypothetical protein